MAGTSVPRYLEFIVVGIISEKEAQSRHVLASDEIKIKRGLNTHPVGMAIPSENVGNQPSRSTPSLFLLQNIMLIFAPIIARSVQLRAISQHN
jgi:hypothetical protein